MAVLLSRLGAVLARAGVPSGCPAPCLLPALQRLTDCTHGRRNTHTASKGRWCHFRRSYCTSHTVDPEEMKKFLAWSAKWWDEEGVFSALHAMNDIRVPFVRDILMSKNSHHDVGCPLAGVEILDVGCGGGILSEPLARLGASVTGIDPLEDNIMTASLHKSADPALDKRIRYKPCSLEELVEQSEGRFDAVVASEVIEHVIDPESFIQNCSQILKPGGSLFITTINKTTMSYVLGIVVAEKMMSLVPDGTHDWEKFISPEELERLLESNGFVVDTLRGMLYNPCMKSWRWFEDTSINYALHAVKRVAQEQAADVDFEKEQVQPKAAEASM